MNIDTFIDCTLFVVQVLYKIHPIADQCESAKKFSTMLQKIKLYKNI